MPNKRNRVYLSVSPSRIRGGLKFGDEQEMRAESGRLCISSVFLNIIISILDLYRDPSVQEYMKKKGVKFLNLIHDSVRKEISRH